MPAQGGDLGAGGGVPDAGRAVVGGGDDAGAVGRERGALHPILVPAQGGDLGAGGGVPDAGRAVVGGGDDAGAVGRERGALHRLLVPAQGGDLGAGGGVPDAGRAVVGGGDDAGAVGRERGAPHRPSCPRRLSRSAPGGVSPGQRGLGRQSGSSRAALAQGRLVSPSRPNNWQASIRHNVTANAVVELPFGHNKHFLKTMPRWADAILGGWQVSLLGTLRTGTPMNISNAGLSTNYLTSAIGILRPGATMPDNHMFADEKGIPSIFPSTTAVQAFEGQDPGTVGTRGIVRVRVGQLRRRNQQELPDAFRRPPADHARRSVQRLQPRELQHSEPQSGDTVHLR